MRLAKSRFIQSSLIIAALIAIAAGVSAQAEPSLQPGVGSASDELSDERVLLATTGFEKSVFANQVAARDSGGTTVEVDGGSIKILASKGDGSVCYVLEQPMSVEEGCFNAEVIEAGVAFSAAQDYDGPVRIVGIVPDEVSEVEIAGRSVRVFSNVWSHVLPADSDASFTVRSDVTDASVEVRS